MKQSMYKDLAGVLLLILGTSVANAHSAELKAAFNKAEVSYPPKSASFLVFKKEKMVQVYATGADGDQHYITSYPVEDVAGVLGPKLRQGDLQVPEGIYSLTRLDSKSEFHRALHINYPNDYDRARAAEDGRKNLGGGIVFHGHTISLGCVAVSNAAVDDLYAIATAVGAKNVTVIIASEDFRHYLWQHHFGVPEGSADWVFDLYDKIDDALEPYPLP